MKRIKFFASILLMLCLSVVCCAQTKIDWKQIKNIPDTLEFKNVLLEHLLFKSAYQPVMESIHQGAIYYDNMLERLRVYEHGQWRDLSVSIASDSIGAPLTILGYLQASDIYASQSAYIGKDVNVKGNVNASGTSTFKYLKVNNALKVPTVASAALGVGSVYYDTSANKLKVLNSSNQWKVVSVDVDSALSTTSTNPVQNKAITAKINQTDANLINGMATTLQQSYNYANGIATQAYNYADSAATDAETASKNYANTQIGILRSYVSQQLGSGTSDLNVNSVKARNASFTDNLQLPFFTGQLGNGLLAYDSSQKHLVLTYQEDVNQYASKAIADKHYVDRNYVSDVATGSANGTISVTKNGSTTNISVGGNAPSSSTPPSNPQTGQFYYNPTTNVMYYWNGTQWVPMSGGGSDIASCVVKLDLGNDCLKVMSKTIYSGPSGYSHHVHGIVDTANCTAYVFKISDHHKILQFRITTDSPSYYINTTEDLETKSYAIELSDEEDSVLYNQTMGMTIESMFVYDSSGQVAYNSPIITKNEYNNRKLYAFDTTFLTIENQTIFLNVIYRTYFYKN